VRVAVMVVMVVVVVGRFAEKRTFGAFSFSHKHMHTSENLGSLT
jgi:hypothetical protein